MRIIFKPILRKRLNAPSRQYNRVLMFVVLCSPAGQTSWISIFRDEWFFTASRGKLVGYPYFAVSSFL